MNALRSKLVFLVLVACQLTLFFGVFDPVQLVGRPLGSRFSLQSLVARVSCERPRPWARSPAGFSLRLDRRNATLPVVTFWPGFCSEVGADPPPSNAERTQSSSSPLTAAAGLPPPPDIGVTFNGMLLFAASLLGVQFRTSEEPSLGSRRHQRQAHRPRLVWRLRREVLGGQARATARRLRPG